MTPHAPIQSMHRQSGFSLIELLISMVIALVVMGAAMSAYVGTAGSRRVAEAESRMNEDAQAAMNILAQQIRMAGNNPYQPNRIDNVNPALSSLHNPIYGPTSLVVAGLAPSNFSVRGCDGTFTNISTAGTTLDTLTCTGGVNTLADSIAVNYEADRFNTVPTAASIPTDCLGSALPVVTATLATIVANTSTVANVTYTVADNRFYITTLNGAPTLYCRGSASAAAQPLVENIEDMQLLYGTLSTATTATTATIAGYLTANEVVSHASIAGLATEALRWEKVASVRLCLIVRSEEEVAPDTDSAKYLDCAGTLVTTPPDLRLRRAYSTTILLRNRRL